MVLSWYEQKAACIFADTAASWDSEHPPRPHAACISLPKVLALLTEQYHIAPTTTPEADLSAMLG